MGCKQRCPLGFELQYGRRDGEPALHWYGSVHLSLDVIDVWRQLKMSLLSGSASLHMAAETIRTEQFEGLASLHMQKEAL
jgi:hypothetical protein